MHCIFNLQPCFLYILLIVTDEYLERFTNTLFSFLKGNKPIQIVKYLDFQMLDINKCFTFVISV